MMRATPFLGPGGLSSSNLAFQAEPASRRAGGPEQAGQAPTSKRGAANRAAAQHREAG